MMKISRALAALGLVCAVGGANAAVQYTVNLLEGSTGAHGINGSGQVAGAGLTAGGRSRAIIWNNGVATDLGSLSGGRDSFALGINSTGQIVGGGPTQTFRDLMRGIAEQAQTTIHR
jgi:probable HAF family extracellular repeat protein